MSSPHEPLSTGSTFGPYRLDRLIGRGGMGEVFQAYDTVKDRTVAIKVLPERLAQDPVFRQRFQRESHAAARLREAHVIPIHDYGEIDGRLYIDMRLVDGDSLRSLLHRAGSMPPERAVVIIEQVASALDAAHRDGLLHRDVKPDNILLTHEGFVYLVDFGIAQSVTDESLTQTGGTVGSYRYMAPERFSTRELGPTADVYALACVLFESLTGTKPFSGETDAQIMRAHLFDPIPRPSLVRAAVPVGFDAVVARGMAKNPDERYSSAGELAAAAHAALGEPVTGETGAARARAATVGEASAREPLTTTADSEPTDVSQPAGPAANIAERQPDSTSSDPGTGSSVGTGTGPQPLENTPTDTGATSRPPTGSRLRRVSALLGALVLVCAALGFAGWEFEHRTTSGKAVGDASALRGADIGLLSLSTWAGYHRANCFHGDPDPTALAYLLCKANPAAYAPTARFIEFRTAAAMHDFYTTNVLRVFGATNCAGGSAGTDAPTLSNGKEVGRKACYLDKTSAPSPPLPAMAVTSEENFALAVYIWNADETAVRDQSARLDLGQFRSKDSPKDPDFYTDADRYLLQHMGDDYTTANCIHDDPPMGGATAILDCATPAATPSVSFIGFADRNSANTIYQAQLAQNPGHSCGNPTGSDDIWRRNNAPVGRFFCMSDKTEDPNRPMILAVHDDLHLLVMIDAERFDTPDNGPKTEAALLTWFQKYFVS